MAGIVVIFVFASFITLCCCGIFFGDRFDEAARRPVEEAKRRYHCSLRELRESPNDPNLRKSALDLGREYSRLSRGDKTIAMFDELSLKNDIDAACAGAALLRTPQGGLPETHNERIEKLNGLLQAELITESEYEQRRNRILDSI